MNYNSILGAWAASGVVMTLALVVVSVVA